MIIDIPLTFLDLGIYGDFLIKLFERENKLTLLEPSPEFVGHYTIENQNEITTRILITSNKVTKLQSKQILELNLPIINPKLLKGQSGIKSKRLEKSFDNQKLDQDTFVCRGIVSKVVETCGKQHFTVDVNIRDPRSYSKY